MGSQVERHNKDIKILVLFHTPSNDGYAMTPLEKAFFETAKIISGSVSNVFFAFANLNSGRPKSLPDDFQQFIALDYKDNGTFIPAGEYIKKQGINRAFCFDIQPDSPVCSFLRANGVTKIISYWGATMSSENFGLKLLLKKLSVLLMKNKPDHFIFESEAMRALAVNGRGIAKANASIIPLGVDITRFHPCREPSDYVHKLFGFPVDAQVVFYSGHMEERKGVRIIVECAIKIFNSNPARNIHFLICGNKPGENESFLKMLEGTAAQKHVHFGGYRDDLPKVMPCCSVGVIASTGWDSLTMSSVEMAASGLPIVVSRLQGLVETLEDGVTGFTFNPGDASDLAEKLLILLSDEKMRQKFSENTVKRILNSHTQEHQIKNLVACLQQVF